jgi:CBS domain-containing protein
MSANFPYCTPEHNVQQVAEMMSKHDCGEVAVVDTEENLKPIGVITDRDIVWRCGGCRQKPRANERARCYVGPPVTVTPEAFYG